MQFIFIDESIFILIEDLRREKTFVQLSRQLNLTTNSKHLQQFCIRFSSWSATFHHVEKFIEINAAVPWMARAKSRSTTNIIVNYHPCQLWISQWKYLLHWANNRVNSLTNEFHRWRYFHLRLCPAKRTILRRLEEMERWYRSVSTHPLTDLQSVLRRTHALHLVHVDSSLWSSRTTDRSVGREQTKLSKNGNPSTD
jgi:hypothetical protein